MAPMLMSKRMRSLVISCPLGEECGVSEGQEGEAEPRPILCQIENGSKEIFSPSPSRGASQLRSTNSTILPSGP